MTPKDVVAFAKENNAQMIDYKFLDFVGIWQHFSVPVTEFSEDTFEEGIGFDGSSIRGWQPIHNSDMLLMPDPMTAKIDPFIEVTTLSLICDVIDPITREGYTRDPRFIAKKAEAYLKSSGIADTAYFGPEPEFFIFDDIRYGSSANESFYSIDSVEGAWNTGREEYPNLGYKPRHKEGYFPCAPTDSHVDLRNEMVQVLQSVGMRIEAAHHEVATGGQNEIDMRFDSLLKMGDTLQWFKYIVKNVAVRNGKTVTFMPKPLYGDNGSGMHCHQSLWKDGTNLFAGDGYGGLSKMAMYYIGGIMKHAKALCAFTNPSVNSYKRLVPGFEAPVNLAYSNRNRSASLRIPVTSNPKSKRVEYRTPDPSCNGYLAFAAQLMAGLDGIENKIDPGQPLDKDIYGLSPEELKDVPNVARSLEDALNHLREDHAWLLKGDVFTEDVIEKWIEYKMEAEVNPNRMRPTPTEFALYYDC
ncbi:type I glutamate--ammonia ligase [Desulfuromonas carbonis]|uniref:type I glutamate--ammonia ligase n=1 Tax=Desulfuromonas sp. DDH964 TaxID=1823759 RepID=UPI00078CE151|nr:type I glutamate--ammonia ligase [Desulfuromonas sp. DDH964]AMV72037.1 glutamine synthetase, type I [Desulfuromonas sp. DDH964]